jgi:WhiB family redox-sensing transcriptional regulator
VAVSFLVKPPTVPDLVDLGGILERPSWTRDALCQEYPEVNFFPGQGEDQRPAKAVCSRCLVREECAAVIAAMPSHIAEHGIWGGTSARERRLAGGRRPRPVVTHLCAGGCGKTLPVSLRCCSSTCRSRVQRGRAA